MASTTQQPTTIPPGQAPPLYIITPTDQSGTIVIVTAISLCVAVVSILVRVYVLLQSGTFRLRPDDWAISVALLLVVVQTSLVQREADLGLGRTIENISSQNDQKIQQLQFADQLFYILSVWICKTSAALFFYRLSPRLGDRKLSQNVLILIGVTGVAAVLMICLVCNIAQPWHYFTAQGVICGAPYNRWIAVSAINIFTEVALGALAVRIFWPLQMRIATKFAVGFIFLQRLTLIVPIVGQLHFLSMVYHSDDPTLQATYSTLCKEVEVTLAIVATSVQCFRPFLLATATNYGAPAGEGISIYGQSANTDPPVELADLSTSKKSRTAAQLHSAQPSQTRSEDFTPRGISWFSAHVTSASGQHCAATSIESDDSTELIIRKDVDYNVHYHNMEAGSEYPRESD